MALKAWSGGSREAAEKLMPLVYDELRKVASRYLRKERSDHTLQPTALVNEAYLKLVDISNVDWQDRAHFFAVASQVMRRILVDHARARMSEKRAGDRQKVTLNPELVDTGSNKDTDLLALDDALNQLSEFDERQARIVELRFFGGLSVEETALVVGISTATVKREWAIAKAWLYRKISW
jgi:RNA polymerase sigma-70 factor (ECF subfamily)